MSADTTSRTVWLTAAVMDESGLHGPDVEYACDTAEAERLIALGFAVDPDARASVAVPGSDEAAALVAVCAERDALRATVDEATQANTAFAMRNEELHALIRAREEQISALAAQVAQLTADLEKAKKK